MYPLLYYLVSIGLLTILIRQCQPSSLQKRAANPTRSDTVFLVLALVLLAFMRVPSVFYNRELNPDESQLLTQAITLVQDPVYGRSVDGTSIGPINSYLLLIPHFLGLPLDFTAARLVGLLLIAGSLVFFFYSLLRLTSPLVSRLTFLPALLFFSWATHSDFLHYSSELSSLVIISVCFLLTLRLLQSERLAWVSCLGVGVVAGLVPYAKLQTLPIVGMMLICLTLYLFNTYRQAAVRPFLILSAGFLLPTVVVFSLAYGFGVEQYFIDYYFIGNLTTYAQIYAHVPLVSQGIFAKLLRFPAFLAHYSDFLIFIVLTCAVVVLTAIGLNIRQHQLRALSFWSTVLVGLTTLGAFFAVVTPGTEFGHHLLLLLFPLGWVTGLGLESIGHITANQRVLRHLPAIAAVLFFLDLMITDNLLLPYGKRLATEWRQGSVTSANPASAQDTHAWLMSRNPSLFSFPSKTHLPLSPVSQLVKHYTTPSDRLAVWGWSCRFYVETGLAQGVSENHTQRSIIPNTMQNQYLDRYARELQANRPALFLDAVGNASFLLKKPSQEHEHFAAINRVIQQNYGLVSTVDSVRIYARLDRLKRLSKATI